MEDKVIHTDDEDQELSEEEPAESKSRNKKQAKQGRWRIDEEVAENKNKNRKRSKLSREVPDKKVVESESGSGRVPNAKGVESEDKSGKRAKPIPNNKPVESRVIGEWVELARGIPDKAGSDGRSVREEEKSADMIRGSQPTKKRGPQKERTWKNRLVKEADNA